MQEPERANRTHVWAGREEGRREDEWKAGREEEVEGGREDEEEGEEEKWAEVF